MPDSRVPADAVRLPILSRRSLLAGATSLAATALAPAASLRPTQATDELTALGTRFEQALGALDAAQRAFNDCECRYLEEGPDPPPMLTRAGALSTLLRHEGAWWRARELRWLLKDDDHRAEWPAAHAALRVALAYEARDRRFRRKLGLRAAERAQRAALDAVEALSDAILAAPAGTAQGLAVQGRGENFRQARMVEPASLTRRRLRTLCCAADRPRDRGGVIGGHEKKALPTLRREREGGARPRDRRIFFGPGYEIFRPQSRKGAPSGAGDGQKASNVKMMILSCACGKDFVHFLGI
ncbi:MAG: hypothetical protein QOF14_1267 [Hyphomicrobiales bacterium]|jgi:hypothetical protein|nr:hypothetical protein [Hyphomicrobiales bacterium]